MNKRTWIAISTMILALGLFALPAAAAIVNCGGYDANRAPQNPCGLGDLVQTVVNIINFLLAWAWIISMFFILWAAYTMIGSGGNEEEITKGKETFKHAILGFFLIMAAFLLINWVIAVLTAQDAAITSDALWRAFNLLKIE